MGVDGGRTGDWEGEGGGMRADLVYYQVKFELGKQKNKK